MHVHVTFITILHACTMCMYLYCAVHAPFRIPYCIPVRMYTQHSVQLAMLTVYTQNTMSDTYVSTYVCTPCIVCNYNSKVMLFVRCGEVVHSSEVKMY